MNGLYQKVSFVAIIVFTLFIHANAQVEESIDSIDVNTARVMVLPFEKEYHSTSHDDIVQFYLINSLLFRNCFILNDPSYFKTIDEEDIYYRNVSIDDAKRISDLFELDLLFYGEADFTGENTLVRNYGLGRRRVINRPVKIYVYDSKSNSIIFTDRLRDLKNTGIISVRRSIAELMDEVVSRLVSMGYLE